MAEVITMPRLSDTMEEGTVASWLKQVGDKVREGDILAEIETDKATMEFESFYEGTLLHIGIKEGETAKVDALLAIIGKEGEDISPLLQGKAPKAKSDVQPKEMPQANDNGEAPSVNALPEGVQIITMPRLSDTMEEGTVASWLKKEGDSIAEGDILAEIETDKATMEFESFYSGTLLKIGIPEGGTAKVDALLAIIGPKGTDVSGVSLHAASGTPKKEMPTETSVEAKTEVQVQKAPVPTEKPKAAKDGGRIFVSPLAKKLAEERGISLSNVQGTGEHGRIVKRDIENYQPSSVTATDYVPKGQEIFEEVPNSQMRKTIAKRLAESKFTAPHYYLTIELDMDNAIASRNAINSDPDVKVSFNDMVVKACAMALRKHPKVNSHWDGDVTKIAKHIHLGVAVAVDDGLLVPVLKFADQMSFSQIGATVKELAGKARNKKLTPDEMQGSTFTVSNLGMFGIKEFTSIINQPNSAILSVGAIIQKPVVKNGAITIGNTMTVTLACDHRTVDGATGAQFLQTLRNYIENPVTMFV
ncbi:MAG TPA: pyruvate dehydrogenase complex dihydrolipoamide acetyltransferase [Flavobacteriaceae bacterium]|nr:pyruvate dehydrogenase complex dihydrolipoamide acetyltransferase [Flavobacteriaceae bacterium]MCB9212855.1 pyruvate dehydrogenase complex dihydrolipoamide acetyltransferase [Alteromonas sp.]HPF11473.1 pyruvate dehydrogenase complex dihydrolipoamide acetyltransferase [Flavobacteriaceae bacterium]HQU20636.1 pyruvate dehydrogenase complex dihydrolipoamide acetyltransferase [Flavobacteriaceae bacterium]HQU65041.1 pyruvate dehydrogenase complex dihydrolipoamide acetyltransferase [Flavobacteriace